MVSNIPVQTIPVKVYQGDDRITVAAPMPGMEPGDIVVEVLAENHVTLDSYRGGHLKGEKQVILDEWNPGPYHRDLQLPIAVDGERTTVTYNNGVLVVSLPIVDHTRPARLTLLARSNTQGERAGSSGHPGRSDQAGDPQQ